MHLLPGFTVVLRKGDAGTQAPLHAGVLIFRPALRESRFNK